MTDRPEYLNSDKALKAHIAATCPSVYFRFLLTYHEYQLTTDLSNAGLPDYHAAGAAYVDKPAYRDGVYEARAECLAIAQRMQAVQDALTAQRVENFLAPIADLQAEIEGAMIDVEADAEIEIHATEWKRVREALTKYAAHVAEKAGLPPIGFALVRTINGTEYMGRHGRCDAKDVALLMTEAAAQILLAQQEAFNAGRHPDDMVSPRGWQQVKP